MRSCVKWIAIVVLVAAAPRMEGAHEPLDRDSPVIGCDDPAWSPFCEVSYSPSTGALWICFACGCEYVYLSVPPECFRRFARSAAKGMFFNRHIRPFFSGQRLLRGERAAMVRSGRALCKVARGVAARSQGSEGRGL